MPNILALDISSTWLGWCYLQPDRAPLAKSIALGTSKNDIADRCAKAQAEVGLLLAACGSIDCVAIEAPVAQYASSIIAQCRVAGAVLAELDMENENIAALAHTLCPAGIPEEDDPYSAGGQEEPSNAALFGAEEAEGA
jgi:hypothetical protein